MLTTNKDLARREAERQIGESIQVVVGPDDDAESLICAAYTGSRKCWLDSGEQGHPSYHRWPEIAPKQGTIGILLLDGCTWEPSPVFLERWECWVVNAVPDGNHEKVEGGVYLFAVVEEEHVLGAGK